MGGETTAIGVGYLAVVLVLDLLVPIVYLYLHVRYLQLRKKLLLGLLLFIPPAALAVFFSMSLSIVIMLGEVIALHLLNGKWIGVSTNPTDSLPGRLRQKWGFLPKRKADRVKLERDAAELIQEEEGRFSVAQVGAVIETTFGEGAGALKSMLIQEIQEWTNTLEREVVGNIAYYKLRGGVCNE